MHPIFSLPIVLIVLLIMAVISFLFSASETAVISLSKIRLRNLVKKGSRRAASVSRLVGKLDKFLAAILIGNNFVNIGISAIVTAILVPIFGYHWGVVVSTFVSTFFILVACDITPKILATKHTEKVALSVGPLMEKITGVMGPFVRIFIGISNAILKLLRIEPPKRSPLVTEEELRLMIEIGKEEGVVSDEERRMLHRIFEFGDIKVEEVMVPKEKMVAVNITSSPEALLNIFIEQGHARLPVFSGSLDSIAGIIYAHDLLYLLRDKGLFLLQDIIHPAPFVSASVKVNELLRRFQSEKIQIAIVADEHKKTLGLVTLEDLIEEIVGEIDEQPQWTTSDHGKKNAS